MLAELGRNGTSAQLTVRIADEKVFAIVLANGKVVGATSPMAVDSVQRIAASLALPSAGPMREIKPRGNIDTELIAYAAATSLEAHQLEKLKRRMIIQRAARTFTLERAAWEVDARITVPAILGAEVDVRAIVFAGARMHLDVGRIAAEFSAGGARFAIADGARAEIPLFELTTADQPILDALREGTSAPEIEALHRELDPRRVRAVFYALATCGALVKKPGLAPSLARGSIEMERLDTASGPQWKRASTARVAMEPLPRASTLDEAAIPMLIRHDASVKIGMEADTAPIPTRPPGRAMTEPGFEAMPTTMRPNALGAVELAALIERRSQAADHFALLGVRVGASVEECHAAYIELTRNLRAERMAELKIRDPHYRARGLLARICIAYTVLTDPERRATYIASLQRSVSASEDVDFIALAREAFERGSKALRSDAAELAVIELRTACELAPNDISYIATLGHAEFCAAAPRR